MDFRFEFRIYLIVVVFYFVKLVDESSDILVLGLKGVLLGRRYCSGSKRVAQIVVIVVDRFFIRIVELRVVTDFIGRKRSILLKLQILRIRSMIRWEDMVLNSDIVFIVTILIQNHIIGVLFIQLLQERKPSLQVLILLPRNVLGKVLVPQSVKVDLLIPQDLVLNLVNNLVDIELIIVVKLIVPVLVEFNQPIIHFRGISL